MSGALPPLLHYAFMAWCSVKAQGQLYLYLSLVLATRPNQIILLDFVAIIIFRPLPVAARSNGHMVLENSNTGIEGSNPTRGMDLCPLLFMLCYPAKVQALRWADPPSKDS
jgi:hypothetical protein